MVGVIKWLDKTKGFGFIRGEDGTERFFHRLAVPHDVGFDSLEQGDRVSFEPEDSAKGQRAESVERA